MIQTVSKSIEEARRSLFFRFCPLSSSFFIISSIVTACKMEQKLIKLDDKSKCFTRLAQPTLNLTDLSMIDTFQEKGDKRTDLMIDIYWMLNCHLTTWAEIDLRIAAVEILLASRGLIC